MALFHLGKMEKKESCCNPSKAEQKCNYVNTSTNIRSIKVLGAGCKSCHETYENTKKALKNTGIDVEVEYITDMEKIMAYGIMSMPALVINEKVVSTGRVLKSVDIENLFQTLDF